MQVRAAVPMYLLARRIKSLGFKVVMSGEGADEIFGGYLYFHKAPSPEEFHRCASRRVSSMSAGGLQPSAGLQCRMVPVANPSVGRCVECRMLHTS